MFSIHINSISRRVAAVALVAAFAGSLPPRARAQSPNVGSWPLEEVVTVDGKTYRGLLVGEQDGEVEFVEVVQPRGKPMYLVVRPIAKEAIASTKRLPAAQRKWLADRVFAFRFRSRIEAGRMENVELTAHRNADDGRKFLRFRGPWFTLDSTADDETTRRCVVRIVQIFRAFRQLMPPREAAQPLAPAKSLRVLLWASMDDYQQFLATQGLENIDNPAVYSQTGNIVVAGSELTRYAERLKLTRENHEAIRRQYAKLDKRFPKQLARLRNRLAEAGVDRAAIDVEIDARQAQWNAEYAEKVNQLNAADRRNERRFAEVTDEMFRRLYHEAFHAYLENYLYPHAAYDVPVWLHEGLAQLFQSGQLDGDTLRVDAPLAGALRVVQEDLASERPITLAELLRAGRNDFLARDRDEQKADRLYAHAWALVYYLAFYEPVLGTEALDAYVGMDDTAGEMPASETDPIARFQRLVDKTLFEFEDQYRATLRSLKIPRS